MLGSLHRFHGHNALNYAYKRGSQVRGSRLTLRYIVNRQRSTYRVAVVVGRKVDKSAVVRNRVRRRVYELCRELCRDVAEPYDMVFSVHGNQLADMPSAELKAVVAGLLKKSGILPSATPASHAIVNPKETRD